MKLRPRERCGVSDAAKTDTSALQKVRAFTEKRQQSLEQAYFMLARLKNKGGAPGEAE